jgi:mRNA deadenylase 3'-5' endonuclease subunit Ccr4
VNPLGGLEGPVEGNRGRLCTTSSPAFTEKIDHIYYKRGTTAAGVCNVSLTGSLVPIPRKFATEVQRLHYPNHHVPSDHIWTGAKFTVVHADALPQQEGDAAALAAP